LPLEKFIMTQRIKNAVVAVVVLTKASAANDKLILCTRKLMKESVLNLRSFFTDKGYKLTTQRYAILNKVVENSHRHLNADDIYGMLLKDYPEIGLVTVYRTLQILEKLKLVSRLNLEDGFIRYQYNNPEEKHQHHHLICDACGSVVDVQEDFLEEFKKHKFTKNKFSLRNYSLKLYGLCEKCMNEN
jgi:Fur family transcriptional regulator, ferric uptake regulator